MFLNHKIFFFHHDIFVIQRQSGRPKRYTCSHVSLLRPPPPKARSRGGRQFLFNNYVEIFFSPNRPYRPYLSHITDRPSLGGIHCSFTYNYVQKVFSPNRPYRPSLSQNENRPSLGGVYCIENFFQIMDNFLYIKDIQTFPAAFFVYFPPKFVIHNILSHHGVYRAISVIFHDFE